jgi:hypothetical protein
MVIILMQHHNLSLQDAVDYVGDLCKQTIEAFSTNKTKLPSWGPETDEMAACYVQGLQDWIVGYVFILSLFSMFIDSPFPQLLALEFHDPQVLRC